MRKKSVRTWVLLFFFNSLVFSAGFSIFLRLTISSGQKASVAQTEQNLRSFSHVLAKFLENSSITVSSSQTNESLLTEMVQAFTVKNDGFRITVIGRSGVVIADSAVDPLKLENHSQREEFIAAVSGTDGISLHHSSIDNNLVVYYATPLVIRSETYVLRLSVPVSRTVFFTANMTRNTIAVGFLILFLTLVCTFFVSLKIVKPLKELHLATIQYERGNFSYRADVTSPREMAELGDSFAHMAHTLEQTITHLKRLERVRKDFVANVSHELKTPVTSIKGFTETLADGAVDNPADAHHFLQIILQQTDRLMAIIEDLLTLSRLEQDDAVLEKAPSDVSALLFDICSSFQSRAQEKRITLFISNPVTDGSFSRLLNQGLFREAIGNVIDNALKYCSAGCSVLCSLEHLNSADKKIRIIIEDNGPGISEEYRERIFERFFRVDQGRSRDMGGTGLGLSIARHIIELHGGTIACTQKNDGSRGARFEIIL
jgi:two-component system, OmpR family, phosphate regulon sensor histidine kinase PhoR